MVGARGRGGGRRAPEAWLSVHLTRRAPEAWHSVYPPSFLPPAPHSVLCHSGLAVRLSLDHKATDPLEKARIEAAGGFILRKRVMGVLAVARSFGDFVLKKFVTAEPYTSTTKLDAMVREGWRGWGVGGVRVCAVPAS